MKLNKRFMFMICFIFTTVLVVSGCGGTQTSGTEESDTSSETETNSQEDVIEMNVNIPVPAVHHVVYNVYEPWKEIVEEETNGRVKVNLYPSNGLGDSTTSWQDINNGLYDATLVFPTYFFDTDIYPLTIGGLPFAFPDSESATNVLTKFAEKYAKNIFKDSVLMGMSSTDSYDLYSHTPLRTLEDLKGKKIRASGEVASGLVKAWGAAPVSLSNTELYESLQKKVVDAVMYSPAGSTDQKLFEVAPYQTVLGVIVTPLAATMNGDFYNKLPDDIKKLFDEEFNPKLIEMLVDSYTKAEEESRAEFTEQVEENGEVITPSGDELKKIKAPAQEEWEKWVQEANDRGYPGEEMMNDFKTFLEEEGLQLPF